MSMDQPQPYMSPDGMTPPPRTGMSTGGKVLLILGISFLVLLLLCCGGGILIGYFGQRYVAKAVSEDPQVVRQVTGEIAQIDVPEQLQPLSSMDMKVPFSERRMMTIVVYGDKETKSTLVLGSFGEGMAPQNREQFQVQMRQMRRQQDLNHEEIIGPREIQEKQITVRGQPQVFTFAKGKDAQSGKPRIEVTGSFPGKTGTAFFDFSGDAEQYDEQRVTKIIESIR